MPIVTPKTVSSSSNSSFACTEEWKHQVIGELGHDERNVHDIFGATPPIYTKSRRRDNSFLI